MLLRAGIRHCPTANSLSTRGTRAWQPYADRRGPRQCDSHRIGTAAAAGLNAYIPLVIVGLLQFFDWVDFGPLRRAGEPWVLGVLAALLAVEVLADKIPAVDTHERPSCRRSSGRSLGRSCSRPAPAQPPTSHRPSPLIAGLLTAGTVHGTKSAIRPVLNAVPGCGRAGGEYREDIASTLIAFAAILAPFLVLIALVVFIWLVVRWRRGRTAARAGGT